MAEYFMFLPMDARNPLSNSKIGELLTEYPALPADYLTYLRDVGWGKSVSGHMIYSRPILPTEVYPQHHGNAEKVILGDDFQGFCLGFDFGSQTFGEFSDNGEWSLFPRDFDLASLLSESS